MSAFSKCFCMLLFLMLGCSRAFVHRSATLSKRTSSSSSASSLNMNLFDAAGKALAGMFKLPEPEKPYDAPFALPTESWKARLDDESFYVLRQAGTERPFTSPLNDEKRSGSFCCKGCGKPLFDSSTKFNSGTGWPSFFAPLSPAAVVERKDTMLGMTRTEVLCSNCGGHLGHVFTDGPRRTTGLRYCINGVALRFVQKGEGASTQEENMRKAFD